MFLIEWIAKLIYGEEAWEKANKKSRKGNNENSPKPRRRRRLKLLSFQVEFAMMS
jgi:hypothetical protein